VTNEAHEKIKNNPVNWNGEYYLLIKNLSLTQTHSTILYPMKNLLTFLFLLFASTVFATEGDNTKSSTSAGKTGSLVNDLRFASIGPAVMSGRVVDLAVDPANPNHFFAAYASGGLWETSGNGSSFTPVFDNQHAISIGAIAVDWKNEPTIWVGTGESNSSRSSYAGNGIYKSQDGGLTWKHLGLDETHHIGRIVIHPQNPDVVWVAAIGHLYTHNPERGVFKTTDGGKTWNKTLYLNDSTGAIDLAIDPLNPNVLYAAMWERTRKAWNFKGNGPGSAIYKSTDGGETWEKITTGKNGFPSTKGTGRIGIAVSAKTNGLLYAILDNQDHREKDKDEEKYVVTKELLRYISSEEFLDLKNDDINEYLDRNGFPKKYKASEIKDNVRSGEFLPIALVEYLEDANQQLFDTPVIAAEVYRSENGGKTWVKTHEDFIDAFYNSYGYYFGNIRISPLDDQKLYILGVPILRSDDGGASWKEINGDNVHADHHALWVNPELPGHLIDGNDGGVNISYDDGETWLKCNNLPVGQFYSVNADEEKNYNVYGGLQDNGVWYGEHDYEFSLDWQNSGKYPFQSLLGGDGMQVEIDTRDNNTVYTGFQFGYYYRIDKTTGKTNSIKPQHELGERPLRFNWQSPIHLSHHNQDILYMGSQKFHRSLDQGKTWDFQSEDLTFGSREGNVPFGTLTTINESPLMFGFIYVGTDDGRVHISKDGGYNFEDISEGLTPNQWVSRIIASSHEKSRVYVSLNGYRNDQSEAMVYTSEDYGKHWQRIGTDLPDGSINVIKEDPENANLLYVGTDQGILISLDRGKHFMAVDDQLPPVAIHDLVVQKTAHDLLIGTHGRSLYRMNVEYLQQLTDTLLAKSLYVFDLTEKTFSKNWGEYKSWAVWYGYNEPELTIPMYLKESGKVTVEIKTEGSLILWTKESDLSAGLHDIIYDLSVLEKSEKPYKKERKKEDDKLEIKKSKNGKIYLRPGKYQAIVKANRQTVTKDFEIEKREKKSERE